VAVAVRVAVTVLSPATTQRQRQSRNNNGRGKWLKLPRNKECLGNFPLLGPAAFVANHSYIVVQRKRTKGQDMVAKRKKKWQCMTEGECEIRTMAATKLMTCRDERVTHTQRGPRWVSSQVGPLDIFPMSCSQLGLILIPLLFFSWPTDCSNGIADKSIWKVSTALSNEQFRPPQQPNQNIIIP